MGRHDKHLAKVNNLNKTVGHGAQPADPKTLGHLSRGQGQTVKQVAKDARDDRSKK